jgi:hypothetical protein
MKCAQCTQTRGLVWATVPCALGGVASGYLCPPHVEAWAAMSAITTRPRRTPSVEMVLHWLVQLRAWDYGRGAHAHS